MTATHFQGTPVNTRAEAPATGDQLPAFELVGTDLSAITNQDFAGKRLVLNIFPSVDTGVCAASVREFNQRAADLENTAVLCISKDLPFALARFCGAEGIENVTAASAFRADQDFGLSLEGSPLKGLLARTVIVANAEGTIDYVQVVPEITEEPDYDSALQALN